MSTSEQKLALARKAWAALGLELPQKVHEDVGKIFGELFDLVADFIGPEGDGPNYFQLQKHLGNTRLKLIEVHSRLRDHMLEFDGEDAHCLACDYRWNSDAGQPETHAADCAVAPGFITVKGTYQR